MGSRSVLNTGSLGSGGFEFINLIRTLISQKSVGSAFDNLDADAVFSLDANGYPTTTPANDIAGTINIPSTYAGNWIIDWTGQVGTGGNVGMELSPADGGGFNIVSDPGSNVSGSTANNLNLTGSNGTVTFNFKSLSTASPVTFSLKSTGNFNGTLANVRLYRADHAALQAGGQAFNPDYLAVIAALNPRIIRFLDWANINSAIQSQFANRPPTTAMTFGSPYFPIGTFAGTSTNSGDAYSVGNTPQSNAGAYVDGEMITFKASADNTTTTPTLNRNSLGAKGMLRGGAQAMHVGGIAGGFIGTAVYDAQLDKFLYYFGDWGSEVPIELQIQFCNEANKDLWAIIPAHYTLASVQAMVAKIRDNLASNLKCHLEYSNEVWNFAMDQTTWAQAFGVSLGITTSDNRAIHGPYGLRVRQFMGAAATSWVPRSSSQLIRQMGFQAFSDAPTVNTYRFQGSDLSSFGYNVAPDRPIDVCDAMNYANYVSGAQFANGDGNYSNPILSAALTAADNYAAGGSSNIASALAYVDGDLRTGAVSDNTLQTMAALVSKYATWQTYAATYSMQVYLYEGNYEGIGPTTAYCTSIGISTTYGGPTGKIQNLLNAYKANVLFKNAMADWFAQFMAQANSAAPATYNLGPGNTQWAVFPGHDINANTPWQSYQAIADFNADSGGARSFQAFWIGGASSAPTASGGPRSLLAFWMGGATAPSAASGGYRSMTAFWMGGGTGTQPAAGGEPRRPTPFSAFHNFGRCGSG